MKFLRLAACTCFLAGAGSLAAQAPAPLAALARMPVKEVTVFKDGHAFVLHEGSLSTDTAGNVLMDYLPTPVLGTFWPYSTSQDVKLTSVIAGQRRVLVERTSLSLQELLEGNTGAEVIVTEKPAGRDPLRYPATIIGVPQRGVEELLATGVPNASPKAPERANVILVRTTDGVKALPIDAIQDVTFKAPHKTTVSHEEFRNLLTLKLDWATRKPAPSTGIGLVYLQKGLRWIPSYKVTVDGNGTAAIRLQSTLVNEMTDISDVTANLVIGVPSFSFQDSTDPMALQQSVTQLSSYFQGGNRGQLMSNAIATQTARMAETVNVQAGAQDLGPDVPESAQSEDLFVFTVRHVSMKKGERLVAPVADYSIPYADVYTLDLPFAPPPEVRGNLNSSQETEMARLLAAPKVAHQLRFTNKSSYPLTTAPALVIRDNRVLAQGLITYTAPNGKSDLEVTKAVDIQVTKTDNETSRTANAVRLQGDSYSRVDLAGTVTLTNRRDKAVDVEVTRHVLGTVTTATNNGVVTKVNVFEDDSYSAGGQPAWWRWYSWPSWWSHVNGVGRIVWKIRIEPGKAVELGYTWNYFWR